MKIQTRYVLLLLIAASAVGWGTNLHAGEAEDILRRADDNFTMDSFWSLSRMTIVKKGKTQPVQTMESYYENADGEDRTLTVFREPRRIKGTAYLTLGDNLWVRFASTGRVRKLSSSARRNSASGSDFSYNDMGDSSEGFADKYTARITGSKRIGEQECYVLELTPRPGRKELYEKAVMAISKEESLYLEVELWDEGAHIKTMTFEDYRPVAGMLYPFKISMRSLARNSVSTIETLEIEPGSSRVKSSLFTQAHLKSLK